MEPHHWLWPAQGGAPGKPQSGLTRKRVGRLLREEARPRVGWGPGLAGEEEGEGADTAPSPPAPPGPSRRVLRCGPAPLHAAPPPLPAAATSSETAPVVTQAVNAAVKGGSGGSGGSSGSGTSGSWLPALGPAKAQRIQEGRRSVLGGVRYDSAV